MDNPKNRYNVVIVGSGLAGVVAANSLVDSGLDVCLIDENNHTGGQLLRKIPEKLGLNHGYHPDVVKKRGFQYVGQLQKKNLDIIQRAIVIGIYPGNRILVEIDEKEVVSVQGDVMLFATGARERFMPFKGWTLPGVISTGMAQVLMKSSGVLPAERMVVGGSGLFLFAVAYELLKNGARVDAVLEQTPFFNKIKLASQFFHQFSKFAEGGKFLARIYTSRVPVKYRSKILEARGNKSLEEVVTARVDSSGKVIPGSEKVYPTPGLAVGYGFIANVELPQLAGCGLEYSDWKGGWIVKTNEELETDLENIFAAGEITGIAGGLKSITEGQLVALSILKRLGKLDADDYLVSVESLLRQRKHHLTFGKYFNQLYKLPTENILDVPDDTIVCRCEDVRMGDIKKAVQNGYNTPGGIKISVRTGMGSCQGRICGSNVFDIISSLTHKTHKETGRFSVRPPIKPVSIGSLAEYEKALEKK